MLEMMTLASLTDIAGSFSPHGMQVNLPLHEVLTPGQHTIRIKPEGCTTGDVTTLRRMFEVPVEGCTTYTARISVFHEL